MPRLGHYHRTCPAHVEDEVRRAGARFGRGVVTTARGTASDGGPAVTVQVGNSLAAGWPGDACRLTT